MGKSIDEEIKETAFQLWRKCGQSPDKTVKTLRELGHMVTRQSIDAWKHERDWAIRAAKAEAIEQQAKDPNLSGEERMIAALVTQQQKYETYFETMTPKEIDSQAIYAFTNLITTIQSIRQKSAAYKTETFIVFWRELINWLNLNDPPAVQAIQKNFDDFVAYAKEKWRA